MNWLAFDLISNDDRAGVIILYLAFIAMSAYIFLNPEEVKKANETERFRRFGFGSKPVWFYRICGLLGILVGLFLFYRVIIKPN